MSPPIMVPLSDVLKELVADGLHEQAAQLAIRHAEQSPDRTPAERATLSHAQLKAMTAAQMTELRENDSDLYNASLAALGQGR